MLRLFRPPRWIDWVYPSCTWRFVVSDPIVFLTFDDGPHPAITPFVLEQLAVYNMKATFFCVGENMVRYPELVNSILEQGHLIGNHTMRHTKGVSVTNEVYLQSVGDFDRNFHTDLFRPPYGKMRLSQRKQLKRQFRIIMWSWLSYDYDTRVSVQTILERAKTIKKGDILVLHDNPKITERQKELLPQLLQLLHRKQLQSAVIPSSVSGV